MKKTRQLFAMTVVLSVLMAAVAHAQSAPDGFDPNANGHVRMAIVQPEGNITPTPTCTPAAEGFDDITALPNAGWVQANHSTVVGTTSWFQGNSAVFPAHSGVATSYIGANFNSTTGTNTISNWLLTPPVALLNGATMSFYTRTVDAPMFPDRLQVRMSINGASSNVGTTATDVGDFTTLLLDINPTYTATGYPNVWTQFTVTVPAGIPSPTIGRLAFRYFVENGGPTGTNSDYIGIDTFQFNGLCGPTPTPAPTSTPTPTPTPTLTPTATATPTVAPTATPPPPMITSPLIATGTIGLPFVYQFQTTGATSLDASNLAPGLKLDSTLRAIVGTPSTAGLFNVRLSAINSGGTTTATLALTVQTAPTAGPVIISSTAATGRVGQPFSFRVYTSGGTPAAMLRANGLPPGLAINAVPGVTGLISGTPTAVGSSAVTLTVTDGSFTTSSTLQLTFTADPGLPVIISPDSATLTSGQFFSYTINAPSGAGPSDPTIYNYIGDLPGGLGFNAATHTISGTYSPLRRADASGGSTQPELAGGIIIGSIQLFATNGHGTSTIPLAFRIPSPGLVNISTRLLVGTGANVLIGGFIITGNAPKIVIIRALGPSTGTPGALQDPTLELHDSANHVVSNDNWRDSQEQIIIATTIAPADNRESAIVLALDPGFYTAIVAGKNGTTGIALVEVYDLGTACVDTSCLASLAEISTRGFVDTGNNVMIGGFIISGQATRVITRAIGPSLTQFGITNALADPTLELRNGSGVLIVSNDDWRSDQEAEIIATGVPPADNRESAIVSNLVPGNYTAIVRGKNSTTGVALVEVYALP